jgi:signal transduction histidine kinase
MKMLAAGSTSGEWDRPSLEDDIPRKKAFVKLGNYPVYLQYGLRSLPVTFYHDSVFILVMAGIAASSMLILCSIAQQKFTVLNDDRQRRILAEEAMRQKQNLAAVGIVAAKVVHDFNNTLQLIQGASTMIRRHQNDPIRLANIAVMLDEACSQGQALTSKVLAYVRSDTKIEEQPICSVTRSIGSVGDLMTQVLSRKHRLIVNCPEALEGVSLAVSGGHLEAVITNLIMNAADASADGTKIRLQVRRCDKIPSSGVVGGFIAFEVSDQGTGMSPEQLAKAGTLFFTTKGSKGTGLGLAGAMDFARQCGGDLQIESTLGVGTSVTLYVPVSSATTDPRLAATVIPFEKRTVN